MPGAFTFTAQHRGGSGPPLVCIHGVTDTWRTWELVLPELERHHDVLAPALPGHAGGPGLPDAISETLLAESVERAMDAAGFATAHIAGNSLGGYVALQLAARGRAESVVAFAPGGGWSPDDAALQRGLWAHFALMTDLLRTAGPHAEAIAATPEGRRRATEFMVEHSEHLPADLVAHQIAGAAACDTDRLLPFGETSAWELDAERITCPLRIVWGTADRVLPWPAATARYRRLLPQADWVELDGVGHGPQLDVPLEAAQLILGFTAR